MTGSLLIALCLLFVYGAAVLIVLFHRQGTDTVNVEIHGAAPEPAHLTLEAANSGWRKMRGLMYRRTIPEDGGMIFAFRFIRRPSFWMKNTWIPLDMIVVSPGGVIAEIREKLQPMSRERITPRHACRYVIEVNGGYCRRHGVHVGDKVVVAPFEAPGPLP